MLVEVGALISWCIYSYRIVMLLVPNMWASMTFLPLLHKCGASAWNEPALRVPKIFHLEGSSKTPLFDVRLQEDLDSIPVSFLM